MHDRTMEIIGSVVAFHDITEKKKMEEGLLRTSKLESIGVLAGGIAHDFNNILTAIFGSISNAKLLSKKGDKIHGVLVEAEKGYKRAKSLTQQLLTFSKGGAPVKHTASLGDLVIDTVKFGLSGSGVRCEYSIPENLWSTEIDEGQISQVIHNLTINAVHAMPGDGTIEVRVKNNIIQEGSRLQLEKGKYVKLSIRDHGTGILKEHIERIFDPYFTTKQEGIGLGLTTTHSIIRRHEGQIVVESEQGVGTVFHIYLPASEAVPPPQTLEQNGGTVGGGRVILMDDDESIRSSVGALLQFLGYEIALACEGQEAIDLYRAGMEQDRPFDAVIMDLTIPGGIGGKEAIRELLKIDPDVKAIVSSGYSNDPVMAEYRRYGFKGVVVKPYNVEILNSTLSSIINNGE